MDLGDKIKSARTQKGITQKELAEETGLTERTIQRIENHEVEPSVYSLNKISEILSFDFQTEKMRIMKRRNQIIYTVMIVWTIALAFNLFFTELSIATAGKSTHAVPTSMVVSAAPVTVITGAV
mgnify:CR=1 FL=1